MAASRKPRGGESAYAASARATTPRNAKRRRRRKSTRRRSNGSFPTLEVRRSSSIINRRGKRLKSRPRTPLNIKGELLEGVNHLELTTGVMSIRVPDVFQIPSRETSKYAGRDRHGNWYPGYMSACAGLPNFAELEPVNPTEKDSNFDADRTTRVMTPRQITEMLSYGLRQLAGTKNGEFSCDEGGWVNIDDVLRNQVIFNHDGCTWRAWRLLMEVLNYQLECAMEKAHFQVLSARYRWGHGMIARTQEHLASLLKADSGMSEQEINEVLGKHQGWIRPWVIRAAVRTFARHTLPSPGPIRGLTMETDHHGGQTAEVWDPTAVECRKLLHHHLDS